MPNVQLLSLVTTAHADAWKPLCFAAVLSLFRTPSSDVAARNSTQFYHMFDTEPDVKMNVQNFGSLSPKTWGPKLCIDFSCIPSVANLCLLFCHHVEHKSLDLSEFNETSQRRLIVDKCPVAAHIPGLCRDAACRTTRLMSHWLLHLY